MPDWTAYLQPAEVDRIAAIESERRSLAGKDAELRAERTMIYERARQRKRRAEK